MVSNKRMVISIAIMTIVFAVISALLLFNIIPSSSKGENIKDNVSYKTSLEKELGTSLSSNDTFGIISEVNALGYDMFVEPVSFSDYLKPCFSFSVTKEGVVVKDGLSFDFYDYPLKKGSIIVKIDDVDLKTLSYVEVFKYIYAKTEVEKKFVLSDNTTFTYKFLTNYDKKARVQYSDKTATIEIANLDTTTRKLIYNYAKDCEKVIIDLSKASISEYGSLVDILSLFTTSTNLFSIPENVKTYKAYKLNSNVEIILNGNANENINFLCTKLKTINDKILLDY